MFIFKEKIKLWHNLSSNGLAICKFLHFIFTFNVKMLHLVRVCKTAVEPMQYRAD